MRGKTILAAAAGAMLFAGTAHADFLDLELLDFPDIASGFIDVTYDANSDVFEADGFALTYEQDMGQVTNINDGSFNISAIIDDLGVGQSGSFQVFGTLDGGLFGEPLLLSGSLNEVGFDDDGGQILEFTFSLTGGDLVEDFGGVGTIVGVIMDLQSGNYSGDWAQSFNNLMNGEPGTGMGNADLAPLIPAPAAVTLFGVAGLLIRRRRRHV